MKKEKFVNYDLDNVSSAVAESECWSDVCRKVGVSVCTFNFKRLQRLCRDNNISTEHFNSKRTFRRGKFEWTTAEVLVKDSTITRSQLRRVLIRLGLYSGVCDECGIRSEWNSRPLVIEIDHVNGDHTDNRVENLRWLCPNCHSQTHTYRRRKKTE